MSLPHGETVTRLRAAAILDPYSGEATDLDWSDPDELAITGVGVEPVGVSETTQDGSEQLTIDARLYVPYQADILPIDRLVVRDEQFTVEGARLDWRNPYSGDTPGSVLEIRRVAG
jgi:head-tail adaptor